ncbi:MAG: aldehyde dehydrogenase [Polyangiaceae bacterium]|jgi:acyl-CoA reductase-like NAD-dependent aldehyde dehydrogenase|nr:aldehyde dehydrogenase [Polyangiaceae bacterium]
MNVVNPATGEVVKSVPETATSELPTLLAAARLAQKSWAKRAPGERKAIITRFRELVVERKEELAQTLTLEVGKPIGQARNELNGLLPRIDFFLEHFEAELAPRGVLGTASESLEERIVFEPLGVIANVSAWNYPYFVGANVFVPALLTGNAVLYKPSELSSLTGLAIAELLHAAGVPKDVFQALIGGRELGAALLRLDVNGVFFTGSYATGRKIAEVVAPRMIRLQLELGGKDPAYITDEVDVAAAAAAVADGAFYNAGQSCCAVERIYVHERIYARFLDAFVAEVKKFQLGLPTEEATYLGPLCRGEAALEALAEQVNDAERHGGRVLTGGKRVDRPGYYFEPTVIADAKPDMRVMKDESFGPIIGIASVPGDQAALTAMADTEYGLTAAVYTTNEARAAQILAELPVGSAYVNCCDRVSPRLPWTGRKHSGIGSTLSTLGIQAFLQPKAWHIRRA